MVRLVKKEPLFPFLLCILMRNCLCSTSKKERAKVLQMHMRYAQ